MNGYKIKYLNEIPAFKTIKKELKGLPGLGEFSKQCYVQILVQKSDSELVQIFYVPKFAPRIHPLCFIFEYVV